MPKLTIERLREHTRNGDIFPFYVLHGEEYHLRNIAARFIADRAFADGDLREFNEDEFSLRTPDVFGSVLAAAEQMPMMAGRRVIRVTDAAVGASSIKDTLKEEYEERLSAYLESPSPYTTIILVADELNGNRKISKLLAKYAVVVEFARLNGRELAEWAIREFKNEGAEIDCHSLDRLLSLVGPDLGRLSNQISKLVTAAKPATTVTAELVDLHVERANEADHFGLSEPLAAGRTRESLAMLGKLMEDGAEPLALIGLLGYNLRKMAISPRGRVPSGEWVGNAIVRNAETDVAIKTSIGGSGPAGSRLQFEKLVIELLMSGKR